MVDIENCVGGAVLTSSAACWAREVVVRELGGASDQMVVGVSHVGLLATADAWPGARLLVKSGPDGADLALLEVLQGEQIAARFDEVVLFSGDGIFTDAVDALGADGVRVTVVGHRGRVAARLCMAAAETRYIGMGQTRMGDAA
ncbi:NYN domain-containing protein [Demequina sp. SYSU T00039]|uniref:NYN domain-containing protein n=1 Tax=Demequina lignilytica TaxID=3051663 RepID=A0AAW7MA45_9MICO|nr:MULTISPECIES: NYN domain-containing protein [unclassified Demequina]MDN4478638.1 NYN domain-containing protein [Demequina sp. SYSU T00039-1]MDN4488616.1 NYN domain-containing protein [Demequina sp. SYSU T00039]